MDDEGEGEDEAPKLKKKKAASQDAEVGMWAGVSSVFSLLQLMVIVEESSSTRTKSIKNPAVDTSFLPDRDREEQERRMREDLRRKWLKEQETIKNEEIEVTYSYWDGSGHRKSVTVSCIPVLRRCPRRRLTMHLSLVQEGGRYRNIP